MNKTRVKLAITLGSASLLAVFAGVGVSSTALAATASPSVSSHHSASATSTHGKTPASPDYVPGEFLLTGDCIPNDCLSPYPCTVNTYAYVSPGGSDQGGSNGCNTRVWLHQQSNGKGRTLCFSPNGGAAALPVGVTWVNVQVTSVTSNCP